MGVRVREKRKGEFWVFIHHQGKRLSRKVGTDEKTARDVAKKIEAKLVLGDFDLAKEERNVRSFKEYAGQWLATYIQKLRRGSTHQRYLELLTKYAYPEIGALSVDKVTRGNIKDLLLKAYAQGISKSTVLGLKNAVAGCLGAAVDAELMTNNPALGLTRHPQLRQDTRKLLDPLNHQEVNLFLETCLSIYPEHYPFFITAFRTGLRLGELLGLRWNDVDFNGKFLRVERSYKLGQVMETKTGRVRRVDMSDQLIRVLRHYYTGCKAEGLRLGLGDAPVPVFHRDGLPIEQLYIRRIFKRILSRAGLREIRMHDIRHTFASLLLSEGISIVYVKEQLGHASISMTVDVYGHWIPGSNRAAVNRLDTAPVVDRGAEKIPKTDLQTALPNASQAHSTEGEDQQLFKIASFYQ